MKKQVMFVVALISALFLNAHVGAFAKDATATTTSTSTAGGTEVKGYTKKDGTKVKGYTRKAKGAAAADDTQQVKGYTKKDGTVVAGYSRKKAAKSSK